MTNLELLFDPRHRPGAILLGIIFIGAAILAVRLVRFLVNRAIRRDQGRHLDRTAALFLSQLAEIVVFVLVIALYATLVPPLQHLGTALLASVSILSIVIGFAAQNTLGNIIAGFIILLYRPFEVGDEVVVNAPTGKEVGVVETLTLGYTSLKTEDNRHIFVPNNIMATQVTVNLTMQDPRVMANIPVRIGPGEDIDRARSALLKIAGENAAVQEVVSCPVTDLRKEGTQLTLKVYAASRVSAKQVEFELLEATKKTFDREGIAFG
ncbi:MAG TPA: mechanosensitive ion channel family protein [Thermoanaerobaculia bacterium]|nr:mechanosensitive ion channel family protein [Thermoanaerobaculia bacterium]